MMNDDGFNRHMQCWYTDVCVDAWLFVYNYIYAHAYGRGCYSVSRVLYLYPQQRFKGNCFHYVYPKQIKINWVVSFKGWTMLTGMFHECQYWTNLFPTWGFFFSCLLSLCYNLPISHCKERDSNKLISVLCLPYVIIFGIGTMNVFIAIYFWIVIIL